MCPQSVDDGFLPGSVVPEGFAQVVSALASHNEGTTVRGLARSSGVSINRAAQVVTQLSSLHLVRVETVGSAKWCHWNAAHPAAIHLAAVADLNEVYRRWLAKLLSDAAITPVHASARAERNGRRFSLTLPFQIVLIQPERCDQDAWWEQRDGFTSAIRDTLGTEVHWMDAVPNDVRRRGPASPPEPWGAMSVRLAGPALQGMRADAAG